MGTRVLAIFSPVIFGLGSGLLFFGGLQGLAITLFGSYLLLVGVACAAAPEKVRMFFFKGVNFDSWSPALKLFVSEEVAIPSIRFSGAVAMVMGGLLLWVALFGPR
jgi:hypothetical protein